MIELVDHRAIGALFGKGADVAFEEHRILPRPAAPVLGAPDVGAVVDHLARTRDVLGLKIRTGIGHVELVVDAELVAGAGPNARSVKRVPAAVTALHLAPAIIEHQIDAPGRGRPQSETGAMLG